MIRPSDRGLEVKLQAYDRFLYLKWNPIKCDFEIWKAPYPSEYDIISDWRPRHGKVFAVGGMLDNRVMEKLYQIDTEANERRGNIDKIVDNMLEYNRKLENEKTFGTDEQRGIEHYEYEKYAFDNGLVRSSAGKLGK